MIGVAEARRTALAIARDLASRRRRICWSRSATFETAVPTEVLVAHRTVAGPAIWALANANFRFATSQRKGFQARQARGDGWKASRSPELSADSIEAPNASRCFCHSSMSTEQRP